MTIIQALILGLIQGLTEFIPVSSSGHLVLLHHIFDVEAGGLAFDVALHAGTLTALLIYFWRDVWELAKALIKKSEKTRLAYLLILATIPAALFGLVLEDKAESTFRSPGVVACNMLLFGLIMLIAERWYTRYKKHISLEQVTKKEALSMGFAQALALIPGVSRSGSTITTGLFMGLDRVAATRFSFLLGIPIMVGATVKVFTKENMITQLSADKTIFMIGVLTALISGLFAIRFMIKYLGKHGLHGFAYYRLVLGIITLVVLLVN